VSSRSFDIHQRYVQLETEKLSAKGFRCIPLVRPLPDVIAIQGRDLKVSAVEVIHKTSVKMTTARYKDIPWYDNVLLSVYPAEPPETKLDRHTVIVGSKGRMSIPKMLCQKMNINVNAVLEFEVLSKDQCAINVLVR